MAHMGPENRKYEVKYHNGSNTVDIIDIKAETKRTFSPVEFVYGQSQFNEDTNNYPNYVHAELWKQYERK